MTTGLASGLVDASGSAEQAAQDLARAWLADGHGAPIVAISDNPAAESDPNDCLRFSTADSCTIERRSSLVTPDPFLLAAEQVPGARALDFTDLFCDGVNCRVVISGANVYRDQDHLTATFANTMGPAISRSISDVLGARR